MRICFHSYFTPFPSSPLVFLEHSPPLTWSSPCISGHSFSLSLIWVSMLFSLIWVCLALFMIGGFPLFRSQPTCLLRTTSSGFFVWCFDIFWPCWTLVGLSIPVVLKRAFHVQTNQSIVQTPQPPPSQDFYTLDHSLILYPYHPGLGTRQLEMLLCLRAKQNYPQ